MKFLLDMPMPERAVGWLRSLQHDAAHARDLGLAQATDAVILQQAQREGQVVITMDLDFPHLLLNLPSAQVGVILIRLRYPHPQAIRQRLEALFENVSEADWTKAIVVLEEARIRLHRFPVR